MRSSRVLLSCLLAIAFAACGDEAGGGSGGGSGGGGGGPDGIADTLERLGVDLNAGPRRDPEGGDLPADYLPVGSTFDLARIDELFVVGIEVSDPANTENPAGGFVHVLELDTGATEILDSTDPDPAWLDTDADDNEFTRSTRDAVAADVDGDGRDEIVVVFVDPDDPAHDEEIQVLVKQDALATTPFAESTSVVGTLAGVVDITAAAADFDGDGVDELAIAAATASSARIFFLTNTAGALAIDATATKTITPSTTNAPLTIVMDGGQLDYDGGEELAVVVNERVAGDPGSGIATWRAYDDASGDHVELESGAVQGVDGAVHTAIVADVAMGDVDGDNLDEILLGGLEGYHMDCTAYDYLAVAIDDAAHDFVALGADAFSGLLDGCNDAGPHRLRWVHVNAVDLDGDRVDEFHVNQYVYDSFVDAVPFTQTNEISGFTIFADDNDQSWVDRSTFAMAVGDVNADGRQDILVYSQAQDGGENAIFAFGEDMNGDFAEVASVATQFRSTQDPGVPLLVPANVDDDTIVLQYSDASYKLVFTEPLVIAALAAAPCAEGIGQNTEACSTTFGTAVSGTTTVEQVLSVSASVSIGVNIDGGVITQSELELRATMTATASQIQGTAYTLTQSVAYTSGPLEDSVVFTTLPYDVWTYTVVSHPDPAMVGQPIVVALPREPITLIAEREFYNSCLEEGVEPIGENVFQHTVGDLSSYPTVAEKNAILGMYGGLQNGPQSVGQGTSQTELGLAVGEEYTSGQSLELGYEVSVEATAGTVLVGFSVGASAEDTLLVTSGTETSYTGSVGSIDAEHFAENLYSFGLFTYVYPDPITGREFEVVNYWVE